MKTNKAALKKPAEEECGVWLDVSQLKKKAKQKQLARPISKLLNPFLKGVGYNVDVALSFTQTKIEMPKTKQTTISAFFTPQRRVLKDICTSDEPNTSPALKSSSSPVLTKCAFLGKPEMKQRRDTDQEPDVQSEWKVPEDVVWQEHTGNSSPLEESEISAPQRKRRCIPASLLHGDTPHSLEAWSQDPLFSYSQCTEDTFDLRDNDIKGTRNLGEFEQSQLENLQSETAFGLHLSAAETTSTQKPFKQIPSSLGDSEKENVGYSLSLSPKKHPVHSRVVCPKHKVQQQNHENREKNSDSQFERTKPRTSPMKKPNSYKTDDDDSLAMLFTQDSEGFRVIAHRNWQVRSPLKDQNNMTRDIRNGRSSPSEPLLLEEVQEREEEGEEEELKTLFTQDSQGNLVIKH